jgi:hypothetical protein
MLLRIDATEAFVTRRTLGIMASVVGSALGAWWWTTQRRSRAYSSVALPRERGTVIFGNTPTPSDIDAII